MTTCRIEPVVQPTSCALHTPEESNLGRRGFGDRRSTTELGACTAGTVLKAVRRAVCGGPVCVSGMTSACSGVRTFVGSLGAVVIRRLDRRSPRCAHELGGRNKNPHQARRTAGNNKSPGREASWACVEA